MAEKFNSEGGESEIEEMSAESKPSKTYKEAPHASKLFGPVIDYERHGEEAKTTAIKSKQPVKR